MRFEGGGDFTIYDLADVVGGGRRDLREEQVQMVKFQGEKEISQEEQNVATALALSDEVIAGQFHLKLKENKDAGSITESDVLKGKRIEQNSGAI